MALLKRWSAAWAGPPRQAVAPVVGVRSGSSARRVGWAAAEIGSLIAATLPPRLGYWLADRLGDLGYHCAPGLRANLLANLRQVLPGAGTAARRVAARRAFRHSARNFYDLVRVRRLPAATLARDVTVLGSWLPAEAAMAHGTGVIFVFGHLGAFDSVLQLLPLRGYRAIAVTAPAGTGAFHEAVTILRGSRGFCVEGATLGGLRRLTRALRRGEAVVLAADRDFQGAGVPVQFFGRETTLPGGAVRLALATGAAIVVVICRRHGRRHVLTIEEPLQLCGSGDATADLREGVAALAATLERHIRATPEQWVMFQPVWPAVAPPAALPVDPASTRLERSAAAR